MMSKEVSKVQGLFLGKVITPVNRMSQQAQDSINLKIKEFIWTNKENFTDPTKVQNKKLLGSVIDNLLLLIERKGEDEKLLWNTAGKVLQRQKHRVIYNKKIDEGLKKDMERLTQEYLKNVMDTYRRYFFADIDCLEEEEYEIENKLETKTSNFDKIIQQTEVNIEQNAVLNSEIVQDLEESDLELFQELEGDFEEMDALCDQIQDFEDEDNQNSISFSPKDQKNFEKFLVKNRVLPVEYTEKNESPNANRFKKITPHVIVESKQSTPEQNYDIKLNTEGSKKTVVESAQIKITKFTLSQTVVPKRSKSGKDAHQNADETVSSFQEYGKEKADTVSIDSNSESSVSKGGSPSPRRMRRRNTISTAQIDNIMKQFIVNINPKVESSQDISKERSSISSQIQTPNKRKASSNFLLHYESDNFAFYNYLPNDKTQFAKMFREDARFFSILDMLFPEEIQEFMNEFYYKYYAKIFYIFQYYQAESVTYPGLSWMLLNSIISDCHFFEYFNTIDENGNIIEVSGFDEAQSDKIFKDVFESISEVLREEHSNIEIPQNNKSVNRAGFMSYLARTALHLNCENPNMNPKQSLQLFFTQFFKYAKSSYKEYQIKKTKHIQTESISEVLHLFQMETEEVFDDLKKEGFVQLKDLIDWMDLGEIILGEKQIQKCFLYSKMPVIEEYVVSGKSYTNMEYVEFLEFLVRVCELDFYNEDNLTLKDKVERSFKKIFFIF